MQKIISYILLILLTGLLIFGWTRVTEQEPVQPPGQNEQYYRIVSLPIPHNLNFAGEEVPLDLFYVREALDRELMVNTYWHSATLLMIKKSHRYFPLFDSILRKNNIPIDFKYIAIIESGLANVVSPAGAVGFWQLMKGTAKDYGLEVDGDVDERYNVEKSTETACAYLLKSYESYGNWTLAAASYNAGQNGINRQIDRQKTASFYDLLLSDETSRYIYRILAMKLILENPEEYGFYVKENEVYLPIPTKKVLVNHRVDDWAEFANEYHISYKLLKQFNPWLRENDLKNRKKKTYYITIPLPPYDMTHEELKIKKNGLNSKGS
ncbi:MAG: lytic transglycosylase domain-containing protein [Bacteroidales bacterium]|nr:lytic transglycosylase domain-containing protein [Bacteroidales bacterium]